MKHIYLFLLLLIVASSNAQTRFAKPGAKWCITTAAISGGHENDPLYAIDSTINNTECSYIPNLGCVYVQNDTVYNIRSNDQTEFLYDYGAHQGDIWRIRNVYGMDGATIQFVVDSVRNIIIGSDTLSLIYTMPDANAPQAYNCNYCFLGEVLEGVGSIQYSFLPGPWGLIDDGMPILNCYSDSIYGAINGDDLQPLDSCSCRFTTAIEEAGEDLVSISYSVSQQAISIDLVKAEKAKVLLYNLNGQHISEDEVGGANYTVSTRALTPGVYFCTVAIEGYKPYTKKIVVLQ